MENLSNDESDDESRDDSDDSDPGPGVQARALGAETKKQRMAQASARTSQEVTDNVDAEVHHASPVAASMHYLSNVLQLSPEDGIWMATYLNARKEWDMFAAFCRAWKERYVKECLSERVGDSIRYEPLYPRPPTFPPCLPQFSGVGNIPPGGTVMRDG